MSPHFWEPESAATFHADLSAAITAILGSVTPSTSDGSLQRVLPKASPHRPYCFAESIPAITGMGSFTKVAVDDGAEFEAEPLEDALAVYDVYKFTIVFTTRPYQLLRDEFIDLEALTFYDVTDTGPPASGTTMTAAREWDRFTDWIFEPALELGFAQHGQMRFRTSDETFPHNKAASGFPRVSIPNGVLKIRWYFIPESYIWSSDSYLSAYLGRLNQEEFEGFPAGSLLYMGMTVTQRHPPPVPERTSFTGLAAYEVQKVVSVELTFSYTSREADGTPPTPVNRNWIAAGHNLLPGLFPSEGGSGFYYCTMSPATDEDETQWTPSFLSAPYPMLFTNPDV